MKLTFGLLLIAVFLAASPVLNNSSSESLDQFDGQAELYINSQKYNLAVADSAEERIQGLSRQADFGKYNGLLFVFDKPDTHGIWMKDMQFSIDIVWLDESKQVTWIIQNASPESYPKVFSPPKSSSYVIEFPAGETSQINLEIGQKLSFKLE
jgi:uncharacterized membrane protein (UPF0127 family)